MGKWIEGGREGWKSAATVAAAAGHSSIAAPQCCTEGRDAGGFQRSGKCHQSSGKFQQRYRRYWAVVEQHHFRHKNRYVLFASTSAEWTLWSFGPSDGNTLK